MKKYGWTLMALLTAAALTGTVYAEGGAAKERPAKERTPKEHGQRFKDSDSNGDGKLSLEEFKAEAAKNIEKRFENADTDKDGFLTREELKAAHGKKPGKPMEEPAD